MANETMVHGIKPKYPNRTMVLLPPVIRKYNGKITVLFCLMIAIIMGMETSYLSTFSSMQQFQDEYGKSSMFLQGILQSCYPLAASGTLTNRH